ncbi:thioesterase II family protein [Kitasatospora sp. NPDC087314]|uniref:thioesterase II family protein n=1 Tax=Kitasatospora sp. NPDC087314 TaxID=3364068 RepID=UPI00381BA608
MTAYLPVPPGPTARPRLFCFPHAGGGTAAYRAWTVALGPDVEVLPVRLPGRERRIREPRITDRATLLRELDEHLGPHLRHPYALYGHSLGGLVAHAFAAHRAGLGDPPRALLIGACPPPGHGTTLADAAERGDEELLAELQRLGGWPAEADEHPRWRSLVLRIVRDDLRLGADLRAADPRPLPVPLHVVAGTADRIAGPARTAGWSALAGAGCHHHRLEAGHFFQGDPRLFALVRRVLLPGDREREENRPWTSAFSDR